MSSHKLDKFIFPALKFMRAVKYAFTRGICAFNLDKVAKHNVGNQGVVLRCLPLIFQLENSSQPLKAVFATHSLLASSMQRRVIYPANLLLTSVFTYLC